MRRMTLLCSTLLALCTPLGVHTQTKPFAAVAILQLADGTSLELSDFSLFSGRFSPMSYFRGGRSATAMDLLVAVGSDVWRTLPIPSIREMVAESEPSAKPDEGGKWLQVQITLTSGATLKGRIPTSVEPTWIMDDGFEIAGSRTILGKEGEFAVGIEHVRRLERSSAGTNVYTVTTAKELSVTLRNPRFRSFGTPPVQVMSRFLEDDGSGIEVEIEKTTVSLTRKDLAILSFTGTSATITVETKKGDKASGTLKSNVARAFGRTRAGEVWFGEIEKVRSIRFPG